MRRLVLLLIPVLFAQDPSAIRVNVNLIQFDATVTDKKGRHLPGLTAADFEVFQNGKRQKISSALWVVGRPLVPSPPPGTSPPPLRPQDVRRAIAILIDDLSLSPSSLHYTRQALRDFVASSLEPGDLVAVYKTSAGLGILQQFTTDKRLLLANIDRITLRTNNPTDPLAAFQPNAMEDSGDPGLADLALRMRLQEEQANRSRQDIATAGSLSTARFIAQGLAELPGRKSIVYFSESLQLYDHEVGPRERTITALRDLADLANRAAVVFYTIDPRGLVSFGFTAADTPSSNTIRANEQSQERQTNVNLSKDGLSLLAEETGGIFYHNRNDIGVALKEAILDQDGYYLLAFTPDDDTFQKSKAGPRYHQLKVRVTRPGAQVRYRHGFVGTSDAERLPVQTNPVLAALVSPFRAVDVPVKLTPMFLHVNGTGSFLRNFAHIDVRPFIYRDVPAALSDPDPTPWKEASLVIAAFLFDANGVIVERASQGQTLRARGDVFTRLLARGIEQQIILLAKKPGPYQVRVAVLDAADKKTGTASQFVEIPDVSKKRLVLSGLTLNGEDHNKDRTAFSSPALRQMRPGERFFIGAFVYNAGPDLLMQISLYRDGKLVHRSKKEPVVLKTDPASGARPIEYSLPLSVKAAHGDYLVELAVQDPAAPKQRQFAVRQIDFTVKERRNLLQ